jgi:ribosome biogenesis GTPase
MTGIIFKAISGFYYVEAGNETIECKARGRFRLESVTPLVGDIAEIRLTDGGKGILEEILPRKNAFIRPPIANLDQLVIIASAVIPVTDPFLIDRMTAIAAYNGCGCVIVSIKQISYAAARFMIIYSEAGIKRFSQALGQGRGYRSLRKRSGAGQRVYRQFRRREIQHFKRSGTDFT